MSSFRKCCFRQNQACLLQAGRKAFLTGPDSCRDDLLLMRIKKFLTTNSLATKRLFRTDSFIQIIEYYVRRCTVD